MGWEVCRWLRGISRGKTGRPGGCGAPRSWLILGLKPGPSVGGPGFLVGNRNCPRMPVRHHRPPRLKGANMGSRRPVHPLLLEPSYWRTRLQELGELGPSFMTKPRPELCAGGRDVVEFQIRTHDGSSLWGLLVRPTLRAGPWPARVRSLTPSAPMDVDRAWVESGGVELIFEETPGRKLEDRVLDVVHVTRLALHTEGVDAHGVRYPPPEQGTGLDAFRIAEQLFRSKLC